MSKLGIHIISWNQSQEILNFMSRAKPAVFKMMEFNEMDADVARANSPNSLFIGRQYLDNQPLDNPKANAQYLYNSLQPAIQKMGGRINVWEGYNEVVLGSVDEAKRYNEFTVEWARLMHSQGLKCAAYSFSTGNPSLDYWQYLSEGIKACDYLALHEYDWPRMDSHVGDLTLRYRKVYNLLPSDARRPLLITETGIDDGQGNGWTKYASEDDYISQLGWYDGELMKDDYVVGATIFTVDGGLWKSFEILPILGKLADYIIAHPSPPPGANISAVSLYPTSLHSGELLNVSITVVNNSSQTLKTMGPDPGFVYDEGDTFRSRGFTEVPSVYRVGIDFNGNLGLDHPYRWGLGAPLDPGKSVTVNGAIKLTTQQSIYYWAGLVQEQVRWAQDRIGRQLISVTPVPAGQPTITGVTFAPTTIQRGGLLSVTITVRNDGADIIQTQGPDPDFAYVEGDTFYTRGFPEQKNAYRVGVDFDSRAGIDHPYRWGLGAPLPPGQSATINGSIQLNTDQSRNYWAGLVKEQVQWVQDVTGRTLITVVPPPPPGPPKITNVSFTPTTLPAGGELTVSVTVKNDSGTTLQTQGPDPGFLYNEGETFLSKGFPEQKNAYRVGIDFDGRLGIDHPYRWGLGAPLDPGKSVTITGKIKLTTARAVNYWAGLVQEQVVWLQDTQGKALITVTPPPPPGPPTITSLSFTPVDVEAGNTVEVAITVRNDSGLTLPTQGPDSGFTYNEGDTFLSKGFPDQKGAYRVGVDFEGRTGWDHPYRWGLGAPLPSGQSTTVKGSIRLITVQTTGYWAGLVQEQVAWLQDNQGKTSITVLYPEGIQPPINGEPSIVGVTFSPTTLKVGEMLQVSVIVMNNTDSVLSTEGPDPGFVYNEGEDFWSRQYPPETGCIRIGVDYDGRMGIDHPYRWGLGASIKPGETRIITGFIKMLKPQKTRFWVGIIEEWVQIFEDTQGATMITVNP